MIIVDQVENIGPLDPISNTLGHFPNTLDTQCLTLKHNSQYLLQFDIKQLRLSVSATTPHISSNPLSGRGFTHVLDLVWFPWRQVWEHSVQLVHCVQYPLTNDRRSEHMRDYSPFPENTLVNSSAPRRPLLEL